MGLRQKRVNSLLTKTLSEIIERELKDPRIGLVTVTSVEVSPDIKYATVFFTVHGGAEKGEKQEEILNHASGYIQHLIAERLELRNTPKLNFKYNSSLDRIEKIESLLKEEGEGIEQDN